MKSFIIFTLSLLLAFPPQVFALSLEQQSRMKEFLELTEITQREVPFREFYGKVEASLPEHIRAPFREYLTLNPNVVLPKFSISKVLGENGEQDLQLSFGKRGEGSGSVRLIGRGKIAAQAGKIKISTSDLENPWAVIGKLSQAFPADKYSMKKYKVQNYGLLSAKQVNSLSNDEKRKYFQGLQQLLAAMEKVETAQLGNKKRKTSYNNYFLEVILPTAWAAGSAYNNQAVKNIKVNDDRNSCIYAGHVTNYGYKIEGDTVQASDRIAGHYSCGGDGSSFNAGVNNRCRSNAKKIQCNSDVYGSDPEVCVTERSINATELCNASATQYDAFPRTDIKDKAGFDKLKKEIVEKLKRQEAVCDQVLKDDKTRLEDQSSTCKSLNARIQEIKEITCEGLVQNARDQRFKDLKCIAQGTNEESKTVTPGGADGTGTGVATGPTKADGEPGAKGTDGKGKSSETASSGGTTTGGAATSSESKNCGSDIYSNNPDYIKAVEDSCVRTSGTINKCTTDAKENNVWVQCACGKNPVGKTSHLIGKTYYCEQPAKTVDAKKDPTASTLGKIDWRVMGIAGVAILGMILANNAFKKSVKALTPSPTATLVPSTTDPVHYRGAQ
jgi:hypothetical protein